MSPSFLSFTVKSYKGTTKIADSGFPFSFYTTKILVSVPTTPTETSTTNRTSDLPLDQHSLPSPTWLSWVWTGQVSLESSPPFSRGPARRLPSSPSPACPPRGPHRRALPLDHFLLNSLFFLALFGHFFLASSHSIWDFNSPTKDQTQALCSGSIKS